MRSLVLLCAIAGLAACGCSGRHGKLSTSRADGGASHAGTDAGGHDAGSSNSEPDAGHAGMDAGRPDAGPTPNDAGGMDAGVTHDASIRDTGTPDTGPADTGMPDTGTPDTGTPDTGTPDAGPRTHGLLARVENTTCFLNGAPPLDIVPIANAPAFIGLTAAKAVAIVPAGQKLALVESAGKIRSFDPAGDGSDATTVLDLGALHAMSRLRSAAFSPDGRTLVVAFVVDDPVRLFLERFQVGSNGMVDAGSEELLLPVNVNDETRVGGALAFLFDSTLAVALGDNGSSTAPTDKTTFAGKVLRIDVRGTSGYTVPPDNPFVGDASAQPEIYALGLGAPSSCTVDRVTGRLWCADTGDSAKDHILLVTKGATLQPILAFDRVNCGALLGFVSRDAALPDDQGALVFGDACTTGLQAMRFDGSLVRSQGALTTLPAALTGFGQDANGRMLAVDNAGALHALVRPATPAPAFPTTLSATGCLTDVAARTPAASLIPFEVRTPLWSDGAKKHRYIVLPGQATIGFTTTGAWQFPDGTMFMKEFLLDDDNDTSTPDKIMETRFLVKRSDTSWEGYSYMWDPARKDAFLLEGAEIGSYPMVSGQTDTSGASVHRHTFPDRSQCLLCHNAASGRALGLQTGRMNTDHDYDGFVENQLKAMDYIGLFGSALPAAPDALPRFAQPADATAPLEDRARSWLYANCSHCHRPGGPTPAMLDFRYETALHDVNACGVTPKFTISQIPNAKIIDPGHSDNSELFFRLSRRDANQMPPLATLITDPTGVDAVQRWIDGLTGCP